MAHISWLVPSLIKGSGGHRTILSYAHALQLAGHQCRIYLETPPPVGVSGTAYIQQLFGYIFLDVRVGWQSLKPADAYVATIWYSADVVARLDFECKRFYLVQDWEALFNPVGDTYIFAENSYLLGLHHITVGSWLAHELRQRFDGQASVVPFGVDTQVYCRLGNDAATKPASVCMIYQPDKPRRCAQLGVEALRLLKLAMPEVQLHLYGSEQKLDPALSLDHLHHGLISLSDCNQLYNSCTVGLCMSASNPSRIPFEMLAAGLPVVELWRTNNLYDLPDQAVLLSEQTPTALAGSLLQLLQNPRRRAEMSDAGVALMRDRDQQSEGRAFVAAVEAVLLQRPALAIQQLQLSYRQHPQTSYPPELRRAQRSVFTALPRRARLLRKLPAWLQPMAKYLAVKFKRLCHPFR